MTKDEVIESVFDRSKGCSSTDQVYKRRNVLSAFQHVFGTNYTSDFTLPIVHKGESSFQSEDEEETRNVQDVSCQDDSPLAKFHVILRKSPDDCEHVMRARSNDEGAIEKKTRKIARKNRHRSRSPFDKNLAYPAKSLDVAKFDGRDSSYLGVPTVIRTGRICNTNSVMLPHRKGGLKCLEMEVQPVSPNNIQLRARLPLEAVAPPGYLTKKSSDDIMFSTYGT